MNFSASLAMPLGPLVGGVLMERFGGVIALNVMIAWLAVGALMLTLSGAVRAVPRPQEWPHLEDSRAAA